MKRDFFFNKLTSQKNAPYFIAEIGVNHNGDIDLAKRMILAAKISKANAVKFQTFKAENLVSPQTPKALYQKRSTPAKQSHYEMIKSLELSEVMHYQIYKFCQKNRIDFISTPYGLNDAKFLNKIGCQVFKTASADLVDLEMHDYLAKKKKIVLISVGMATIEEIKECIKIYKKHQNNKFILLHCVSNYPCSHNSLNLKVITKLKSIFNCEVGFSDHSIGPEAAVLSYALGSKIIEKHFTINKKLKGPDQAASILPNEFLHMVNEVNKSKLILGTDQKKCQEEERLMSLVSRKCLTLKKDLPKNTILKKKDIQLKRPGTGLYYNKLKYILGKRLKKNLKKNYQPKIHDFI
jgi:N,N'-diacetyllegionaminate synthase